MYLLISVTLLPGRNDNSQIHNDIHPRSIQQYHKLGLCTVCLCTVFALSWCSRSFCCMFIARLTKRGVLGSWLIVCILLEDSLPVQVQLSEPVIEIASMREHKNILCTHSLFQVYIIPITWWRIAKMLAHGTDAAPRNSQHLGSPSQKLHRTGPSTFHDGQGKDSQGASIPEEIGCWVG